jgi:hypothetical protein
MQAARTATERALISGSLASLASTAALVALAHVESRRPAAAVNAISHWLYGDESFRHDSPRLRYTLPGYVIHHPMITPRRLRPGFEHKLSVPSLAVVYAAFAGGLAFAALARR